MALSRALASLTAIARIKGILYRGNGERRGKMEALRAAPATTFAPAMVGELSSPAFRGMAGAAKS